MSAAGQPGMSIGALAARTGVPVDTLRAWERRYGVLHPGRTTGGQRRYGGADLERVLWLAQRVAEGQRISDAAAALQAIEAAHASPALGPARSLAAALTHAAQEGDPGGIDSELDRAFSALPLVAALELVVFPALTELADQWAGGGETVACEHLLSEACVRRLSARLSAVRRQVGPQALIACPEGERHAIGALALAVLMAGDGWRIVWLGQETPLAQAHTLAAARRVEVAVCVCTMVGSAAAAARTIAALAGRVPWVLAGPDAGPGLGMEVWGPGLEDARAQAAALRVRAGGLPG